MQARSTALAAAVQALWRFSRRWQRFVLVGMLLLLHFAAFRGVTDDWARGFLVAHFGLLLLWQPFVHGERRVSAAQALAIALASSAVLLWLDWWMLAFWVVLLAGVVGGRVYQQQARWQRRFSLLVFVYLLALLALAVLPEIAPPREIPPQLKPVAEVALLLPLLALVAMPVEPEPQDAPQLIDFFYTVFLVLVLGLLVLGSFAFMTASRLSYLEAMASMLVIIGAAVLAIGLAWNPRAGFGGLNLFVSRYLFSIGMPLERWLRFLAELLQTEPRPDRFLAEGVSGLARLPWVSGARWSTPGGAGETGEATAYAVEHASRGLSLTIYSRYRASPILHGHLTLLAQVLAEFYLAKLREERLREQSYVQAVHETGARMTHDVKNLLQSLNVLCSVALGPEEEDSPERRALLRRQLPAIAQRLSGTLEKLQRPQPAGDVRIEVSEWWGALARQYRAAGVVFSERGLRAGLTVPRGMAESVADNLLQNALAKRVAEPSVVVRAELDCSPTISLRVRDSGSAVAESVARGLFQAPVGSTLGGLGIGLYQAARQAAASGYVLSLERNAGGDVCFRLAEAQAAREQAAS